MCQRRDTASGVRSHGGLQAAIQKFSADIPAAKWHIRAGAAEDSRDIVVKRSGRVGR